MRAAFIITKLAIQHFTEYACKNNEEVIIKAENIFVNFDFKKFWAFVSN